MPHPQCAIPWASAAVPLLLGFCAGALAQDTYTQGASAERRVPAETNPAVTEGAAKRNGRTGGSSQANTQAAASGKMQARDIRAAIESELHHDMLLSLDDVDVSVERGTATLSGTVGSLTARERAARLARTVKGVTDVVNNLVVRPYVQRSAEQLESAIRQALLLSPATESFQVRVEAEPNGSVRLSGKVESWAERQLAEHVAQAVAGVTSVSNDVEVAYTTVRPDTEIAADVERLLQWDAYIDDSLIDVRVRNGVVTLSGSVGSAAERNRATALAWTAGTTDVDAEGLRVSVDDADGIGKPTAQLSDADLAEAVERRLRLSPYTPAGAIDVLVEDEVITLRGTVGSLRAKRVAKSIASQTTGVAHVRDRLRVRTSAAVPTDDELKSRIENALAVNTITEAYEISVDVNRGEVTLTGQVDNWFEKGTADDVAASVRGVREVDNELRVTNSADRLAFDPYVDTWSIYDYGWYQPEQVTVWQRDSVLEREIENELWWSPFVDANEVQVTVENGVATLSGSVDSLAESSAAQENAFEGGAAGVINQLRIEG